MQRDGAVLNMVPRIFPRVIERRLHQHRPGAAQVDRAGLRIATHPPASLLWRTGTALATEGHSVTALAASAQQASAQTVQTGTSEGPPGVAPEGNAVGAGAQLPQPEPVQPERSPARYPWAVLSARSYEVFPLVCPLCGGPMRLIAFITQGARVSKILDHIGVD